MATVNEDYDAAKIIKVEIDRVRAGLINPFVEDLIQNHLGVNHPPHAKTP